jgi:LEA14-like dessication related protein
LAAAGCGVRELARGEIQAPKVTFQGLAVYQPTSDGWPLAANLLLENPNPQPLNLLGYDYQLWIEGRRVATGSSQEAVNLPAGGQTVARVPILVKLDALLGFLPMFLQNPQQKVRYQISGSFRLASVMGGIIPVPFRFQGEAAPREGMEFLRPYLH